MSDIDTIIEWLSVSGSPYHAIAGAVDFATAFDVGVNITPVAFVFFGEEVSGENAGGTGPVNQRQERDLSIVTVTGNLSDATGKASADALETLKTFNRARLIGRTMPGDPAQEPITHVRGAIGAVKNGMVWHEDVFSVPTYIKEVTP